MVMFSKVRQQFGHAGSYKALLMAFIFVLSGVWQVSAPALASAGSTEFNVTHEHGYPIRNDESYQNVDNIEGEFYDSRFIISDGKGVEYIAFCADYTLAPPFEPDDHSIKEGGERDHYASALAVALSDKNFGARLSDDEFNALFGYQPGVVNENQRALIMSCFVWAFETNLSGAAGPFDVTDPSAWPESMVSLCNSLNSKGAIDNYRIIAPKIIDMMENDYGIVKTDPPTGVTRLIADYDEATGRLSVNREGYAGSADNLKLTVSPAAGVQLYVNDAPVTSFDNVPIKYGDKIYIFKTGDGDSKITVRDTETPVLINGSVKGDLLYNVNPVHSNYQRLITGYAEFGAETFTTTVQFPEPLLTEIVLQKEIIDAVSTSAPANSNFTFSIQELNADGTDKSAGAHTSGNRTLVYDGVDNFMTIPAFEIYGLTEGVYYFRIKEYCPSNWAPADGSSGVIYAKVEVGETGGASVKYCATFDGEYDGGAGSASGIFRNKYTKPVNYQSVNIIAYKKLSGAYADIPNFKFAIIEVESDGSAKPGAAETELSKGIGSVIFGKTNLTPGEYYYKIYEKAVSAPGYETDAAEYYVKVAVPDTGGATVTYYGDAFENSISQETVVFNNYYTYADFTFGNFSKHIFGANTTPRTFTFRMREIDGSGLPVDGLYKDVMISNLISGSANAATGAYTYKNIALGTHYYEITEVAADNVTGGWIFDNGRIIIKVIVEAGETAPSSENSMKTVTVIYPVHPGNENAAEAFDNAKTDCVFRNYYTAADVNITITKQIIYSGGYENTTFWYDVEKTDETGTPVPDDSSRTGEFSIAANAYPKTGVIKLTGLTPGDHYYKVTERKGTADGWTYDQTPLYIKVSVASDGYGGYNVDVSPFIIGGSKTGFTFTNSFYKGSASLEFTKAYPPGASGYPVKYFKYSLSRLEGTGDDPTHMSKAASPAPVDFTSAGDGVKIFSPSSFPSQLSGLSPGVYYYSVSEAKNANAPGPSWDGWDHGVSELYAKVVVDAVKKATSALWWNGTGWVDGSQVSDPFRTIVNAYTFAGKGSGYIVLGGMKKIGGGGVIPTDNPEFKFKMTELKSEDADDEKPGGIVKTASSYGSSAGAAFTFDAIKLDVNHTDNTPLLYYFKIEETAGGDGWNNDTGRVYVLTVRVEGYSSTGTVVEVVKVNGKEYGAGNPFGFGDVLFTNVFDADTGSLTIKKVITGYPEDWEADGGSVFLARVKDVQTGRYLMFDIDNFYAGASADGTKVAFTANKPAVLTGLPAGRVYTVEEETPAHCAAEYFGNDGVFGADGKTVTVTNNFEGGVDRLVIRKALGGTYGAWGVNNSTPYYVRVKNADTGKYLTFNGVNAYTGENGEGTRLTLTQSSPVVLTGLPAGGAYIVEEEGGDNYSATCDKTGPVGNNDAVTVTNTYFGAPEPPTEPWSGSVTESTTSAVVKTTTTSSGTKPGTETTTRRSSNTTRPPAIPPMIPATVTSTRAETTAGTTAATSGGAGTRPEERRTSRTETTGLTRPETPFVPGGADPDTPPSPNAEGREIIADGDGFIELDENGVPLGRWQWSPDENMWLFDEFPPLGAGMPKTGDPGLNAGLFILIGLTLACAGLAMQILTRSRG